MADSAFNLHSLLPQRGPPEAFKQAASEPDAFSATCIWVIVFGGTAVLLWVLCQWALVWWRTRRILKLLDGVTPENAAEERHRLRKPPQKHGDVLLEEFDSTLVEDHDLESGRVWLRRTVDAAQIFNERSLARRLIHSRLISATSGLLTALGVLGAFIGLQQGISGLKFVNPQPGEMEASIQTLVNGLTIKFSSSIWGIGCSIIFNVLEKLVEGAAWSRIRRVQTRIDGLFSRYTIPFPHLERSHHRRIKELEARRAEKRRGLFEAQDAVDSRKDGILSEIEARLKQSIREEALFTVRWKLE